jgi:hypothetical protein
VFGLVLFVLGGLVLGFAFAGSLTRAAGARPYDDPAASLFDTLCAAMVVALTVWVATSWALALTGLLRSGPLLAAAALEFAAGAAILYRRRGEPQRTYRFGDRSTAVAALVALAPVAAWLVFVLWRGALLPVYSNDGLSYHLPKAVLLMKAGGFHFFDVPEPRLGTWPCDYELLLADTLILTRSDHCTAAVGTFSYVLMALFAARTAAAWWGGGAHVALAVALVATAPIVILHSGLHKNDLLLCALSVAAFTWGARWVAAGCTSSALLATAAALLAFGTKLNGALVVAVVGLLLAVGARRHPERASARRAALFCAGAAAASFLLGAADYAANLAAVHRLFLAPDPNQGWGDWANLWRFTTMVVLAPFAKSSWGGVWNPFRHEYWWWPENDVWTSHFGAIFSVLFVLLVPCVLRYRRLGAPAARAERAAASLATLATYLATMPIKVVPIGFCSGFVRYTAFVLPVVAAWTVSPVLLEIERRLRSASRAIGAARVATAAGAAVFAVKTIDAVGVHDAYAPIGYVAYMMDHPDNRVPFVRRNRAASLLDAVASPTDACAVDMSLDTWVYPAYGAAWTRRVEYLRPAEGEVTIPDDAQWVVVDRSWNAIFGHPGFVDMGKAYLLGRGKPSGEDLKVYRQLSADPRFELVYDDRTWNQALFRRRGVAAEAAYR